MTRQGSGGDRNERFVTVYTRYYARIVRYLRREFRLSDADADDSTQDAFIRFYRRMDEYDAEAEWALLEKIARNVGLNRLRSGSTIKRGSVRTESLDDGEFGRDAIDGTQKDPIETMIETEQLRRLREALRDLPAGQRQCIQLWLQGYSGEEIARMLRISVVAVKSRIRDAKRTLRERLGDEGELPED